ncbi:hypothetical protein BG011_000461 [Mortierella polycephala]|uniref:Calcineurin-like phosphoesterase domain-containing protein n=1 Tax=Mortierella polycephala TaxID=41804 RepID=A0A9P6QEH6_9FUNG|nr:hypothetical protein BG011_000461 [Mortierella polycephala]
MVMWLLLVPLLTTLVVAHAPLEKRSQPGAPQPDPIKLRPLVWGDLNIIQTTDTHGWLSGHTKEEYYSADFGDFASFLFHMRQQADHRRKDLLVVDSGDLEDGNGLSDSTSRRGEASRPIFEMINYDLLSIGNHELFSNEIAEAIYKDFAPKWGKRYLTSNVFFKDEKLKKLVPFGNLYRKFRMKYGTRVMSYGFIFNYNNPTTNSVIEPSNVTVTLPWFQKSLKEKVDVYLIVGHVPVRFAEATDVVKAIRAVHPTVPIIVMGGHAHVRDFTQYDARAVGMASGRYLETVGWLSVQGIHDQACRVKTACIGKNLTATRRYLDNNRHSFKTHALAHPRQKFDTWKGHKITNEIATLRGSLKLTTVLGCAPQAYYISRYPVTDSRSAYHLVANEILPFYAVDKSRPNPSVVFIHAHALRFDILKGTFSVDDSFCVSPYYYKLIYVTAPFKIAKKVLPTLNPPELQKRDFSTASRHIAANSNLTLGYVTNDDYGYGGDDWPHIPYPEVTVPSYVSSPLPSDLNDDDLVDVIWLDFFTKKMESTLKELDPSTTYVPASYRQDVDSHSMLVNFVEDKWSSNTC